MATITATPEPQYGSVRLEITAAAGDESILAVDRFVTGATGSQAGASVRTKVDQLPAAFPLVLRDYEAPFGAEVYYLLTYESATEPAALEFSNRVTLAPPPGVDVVATVVGQPSIQARVPLLLSFDVSNRPEATVHWPIGETYPRYSLGPVRARSGTFSTIVPGYTVRLLLDVYAARQPVLLRQNAQPGLDLYHVATDVRHRPATATGTYWLVDVDVTEIAYPTMPLVSAVGWTFGALNAAHSSFADVTATYDTFADLFIGPLS